MGRGTRTPVALADHATRPGAGTACERQSLFHHSGLAQYLFGAIAPDWTHAHCAGACRSARTLSGRHLSGDIAEGAWATPAADQLSPPDRFAGPQAGRLCAVPLSRRALSLAAVSPGLRHLVSQPPPAR